MDGSQLDISLEDVSQGVRIDCGSPSNFELVSLAARSFHSEISSRTMNADKSMQTTRRRGTLATRVLESRNMVF